MATFKICVFEHQKRSSDGKYPVSIKVYWKKQQAYIKTGLYVTDKQITKKTFTLKDPYVINELNNRIASYEDMKVKKLKNNINLYSARELALYFMKNSSPGTDSSIDFIEFARLHRKKLTDAGRKSTADNFRAVTNALVDFCNGRKRILITEINVKFLDQFETFLRKKRKMTRINQLGKPVTIERPGLSDTGVHDYMTNIRTLFNAAKAEYNDEDRGEIRIAHSPFSKYKLKKCSEPDKRVLKVEQIMSIRDISDQKLIHKRAIMARDVFILSFYFAGMNTADFYDMKGLAYKSGRLSYYRQKTRDRRQDRAYISLKVNPEAILIMEKYLDKSKERVFCFYKWYTDYHGFNVAVNKGLRYVSKACDIEEVTSYYARFSFASIARNQCGVSVDDIDLCLDHVDGSKKMADKYIKKDWSIVDNAIRQVIDLLNKTIIS